MTNIGNGNEEWKTKVLSMLDDDGVNVTDNTYRVTIDKRTFGLGQNAPARYTFCVRAVNECHEPNAGGQNWSRTKTYFWKFTWGGGTARLEILRRRHPCERWRQVRQSPHRLRRLMGSPEDARAVGLRRWPRRQRHQPRHDHPKLVGL